MRDPSRTHGCRRERTPGSGSWPAGSDDEELHVGQTGGDEREHVLHEYTTASSFGGCRKPPTNSRCRRSAKPRCRHARGESSARAPPPAGRRGPGGRGLRAARHPDHVASPHDAELHLARPRGALAQRLVVFQRGQPLLPQVVKSTVSKTTNGRWPASPSAGRYFAAKYARQRIARSNSLRCSRSHLRMDIGRYSTSCRAAAGRSHTVQGARGCLAET